MIIFINNKVKIAVNNQRIKNKFHSIGIYPMIWVQGPKGEKWDKGDSFKILETCDSYNELIEEHPVDTSGDCYLVNGVLYFWDEDVKIFENGESIVE